MINDIGECAGKVWSALDKLGKTTIDKLKKETGLSPSDLNRAVGWLARESKIVIAEEGKKEVLDLNR